MKTKPVARTIIQSTTTAQLRKFLRASLGLETATKNKIYAELTKRKRK